MLLSSLRARLRIGGAILFLTCIAFVPSVAHADTIPTDIVPDEFFRGVIITDPITRTVEEFGQSLRVQEMDVRFTSGSDEGRVEWLSFQIPVSVGERAVLKKGDRLIVGKSTVSAVPAYYISDVYRLHTLGLIFGVFIFIVILLTKFAGIRALLGLLASYVVIVQFMVPHLLAGNSALFIGLFGTVGIACFSLYLAHGFRPRTTIAFIGCVITIAICFGVAHVVIGSLRLFGLGSEEAFFLQYAGIESLNLQGILLAGIVIGVMGILDDITTAQAAAVEEIGRANPALSFWDLYHRGSSVGREHVISLVNTLVLAYTGTGLPLLMVFHVYERPAWITFNSELIMEEVARMLVGSICLVLAVPITTALAARFYSGAYGKSLLEKHHADSAGGVHYH